MVFRAACLLAFRRWPIGWDLAELLAEAGCPASRGNSVSLLSSAECAIRTHGRHGRRARRQGLVTEAQPCAMEAGAGRRK